MDTKVYIKGSTGFKAAILAKLGGRWIHGFEDCDEDTMRFTIPENILLEDFKETIGYDNVISYNLHFFDKLLEETYSEIPAKFVPGQPFKISIWANSDFKKG